MLTFSNYDSVLHPSLKLNYFCKVGWKPEWIETAQSIVQVEYQCSYKGQYDKESLVPADDSRPTTLVHILITLTVSLESIAMFGSFGLFAVWCFTVWKSHLALQREHKVLLLGFLMEFSSYDLNQWFWRYALFKMEISLQCFPSF